MQNIHAQDLTPVLYIQEDGYFGFSYQELNGLKNAILTVKRLDDGPYIPLGAALLQLGEDKFVCHQEHYEPKCGIKAVPLQKVEEVDPAEEAETLGSDVLTRVKALALHFLRTRENAQLAFKYLPAWEEEYYKTLVQIFRDVDHWNTLLVPEAAHVKTKRNPPTTPFTIARTHQGLFIHTHEIICGDSLSKTVYGGFDFEHNLALVRMKEKKNSSPEMQAVMENEIAYLEVLVEAAESGVNMDGILLPVDVTEYAKRDKTNPEGPEQYRSQLYFPRLACDLLKLLKGSPLSQCDRIWICYKLIYAVNTLHNLDKLNPDLDSIAHGDLKLENIMMDFEKKNPFLIDFGFAKGTGVVQTFQRQGTLGYIAPELLDPKEDGSFSYNAAAADLWALGIILCAVMTGHYPSFFRRQCERKIELFSSKVEEMESKPLEPLTCMAGIYRRFLRSSPADRMPIGEALKHTAVIYQRAITKESLLLPCPSSSSFSGSKHVRSSFDTLSELTFNKRLKPTLSET